MRRVRLKNVADITTGQSPESAEIIHTAGGLPFLQGCAEFGAKFPMTEKYCLTPPKTARKGSWLISVRAPVGALNLADQEYCIGRGLASVHPNDVHQGYLGYVLLDQGDFFRSISTGSTFQAISTFQLMNLEIVLPPLDTQRRVARFLDEKTAKIDELIEKKRTLLDRIAEKRQALITRAVTKGLNPDIPLKPSGVEWLGDVPAHWKVLSLKRVLASATYGISASLDSSGKTVVLRMGNLIDGEIDFRNLRYIDGVEEDLLLNPNDIIFNRTNSLDLVGKTSIYRGNPSNVSVSFASYLVRFRFTERFNPEYANYVMGTQGLMALGRTLALPSIGQANLNPSRYALIKFPVPPRAEQSNIVTHLVYKLTEINQVVGKVGQSIKYLAEYRTALISSAVTGQLADLQ